MLSCGDNTFWLILVAQYISNLLNLIAQICLFRLKGNTSSNSTSVALLRPCWPHGKGSIGSRLVWARSFFHQDDLLWSVCDLAGCRSIAVKSPSGMILNDCFAVCLLDMTIPHVSADIRTQNNRLTSPVLELTAHDNILSYALAEYLWVIFQRRGSRELLNIACWVAQGPWNIKKDLTHAIADDGNLNIFLQELSFVIHHPVSRKVACDRAIDQLASIHS